MSERSKLFKTEDYWAVWLGLGIVVACLVFYWAGSTLGPLAVKPKKGWTELSQIGAHFAAAWGWYVLLFLVFLAIFTLSIRIMGRSVRQYVPGFTIIFASSVLILILSTNKTAIEFNLEPPLMALIVGLIVGNLVLMPKWFETSLLTEYYIKTGIVLLGATLPLTLIFYAGPIAFFQATIVSVSTWMIMYFCATRLFKLPPRFGATLGAAGSVCGVSASIAVGGAVQAEKEQIAVSISIVSVWAIVMIFFLPYASKFLGLAPPVAGAWIGTSEFADAAGFAAASAIQGGGDSPIQAFTLMKVIGRDIWIGIWCFVLSVVAVTVWDRKDGVEGSERVGIGIVWERFPKFVLGFFAATILMSVITMGWVPEADFKESFKPLVIGPIKTLRTWTFVFTFLCIGLTTRFKDLMKFGWPPFWAFTIGVVVNVSLGYVLSAEVFSDFWMELMPQPAAVPAQP